MTASSTTRLSLELHPPLARISFHHPPLNVIDFQLMDELLAALQSLDQHTEISTVLLSGGERGFSAGVDVAVHTPAQLQTMFQKFHGGSVEGVLSLGFDPSGQRHGPRRENLSGRADADRRCQRRHRSLAGQTQAGMEGTMRFSSPLAAKQFLVSKITAQAGRTGVSL